MSLSKLFTAAKGIFNNGVEAAVDGQAVTILEQEIREVKESLRKSDHSRTQILAKKKLSEKKVADINAQITKYSDHARANAESNRDLAIECANKVQELQAQLATEQSMLDQYSKSDQTLAANVNKAKANLRRLEQQVDIVKATDSVQKAQTAVSQSYTGSNNKMRTALDSLERIQEKQAQKSAELEAAEELAHSESGADLDARLNAAGAPASGEDALAALLAGDKK